MARVSIHGRFWAKVDLRGLKVIGASTPCWLWTAGTASTGGVRYGKFSVNGKTVSAHLFAYEMVHGKKPKGTVIAHRCDNGLCVNPAHLEAKTQLQNMRDCAMKGRIGHGARIHRTTALRIRQDRAYGLTLQQLNKRYSSVSPRTIAAIVGGHWVPKPENFVKVSLSPDFSQPVAPRGII